MSKNITATEIKRRWKEMEKVKLPKSPFEIMAETIKKHAVKFMDDPKNKVRIGK